jgi:hypothetical protein
MEVLQVQGDAFSEYYLHKILPQETKLAARLDAPGAVRAWRDISSLLRHAHRELRGSRQARVTRRVLLDPLAELLSWRVGEPSTVLTNLGEEDGSQPLFLNGNEKAAARVLAIPAESSLDLPLEGLHRRFAPAHSLVRILEQEGLTWGIRLNAYELRLVRRREGFVSSHLAFSLLDLASDVPGCSSSRRRKDRASGGGSARASMRWWAIRRGRRSGLLRESFSLGTTRPFEISRDRR